MTTFDIDNTQKTKYLEVLESLVEQAHALQVIHNPQTWRLSALTFALHIHDCIVLFGYLKEKWATRLPFSEAWDVDFTEWKSQIWSLVNNVSSFVEETEYGEWKRLCEEDYHTFIEKAKECLLGELPLKDLNEFLSEKNTELKQVIIDSGQDLSSLFSETETMLYESDATLYERFYDDLVRISMSENGNEYLIDNNGTPMPYARWKASKSKKRLPELILSKVKAASTNMHDTKFWQETWDECFNFENREIDKEGFARFVFQNRKSIIESKQYPCKNCLGRCFATLCLCEHLWQDYYVLMNTDVIASTLKEKIMLEIKHLEEIVKDEYQHIYTQLWNRIFENADIIQSLKETNPNGFEGGYNKKLVCNIVGMMSDKGYFTKSKNKIDDIIYTDKTVYKYLSELSVSGENSSCALNEKTKEIIELILDNPS